MSTRGTIESLIRDKLGVTLLILYLVWEAMQDTSTINALITLGILAGLAGYTLYENHRHIEKMGNESKSKDLILEFKDHLNKELSRFEDKPKPSGGQLMEVLRWLKSQAEAEEAEEGKTQEVTAEPVEPEVV